MGIGCTEAVEGYWSSGQSRSRSAPGRFPRSWVRALTRPHGRWKYFGPAALFFQRQRRARSASGGKEQLGDLEASARLCRRTLSCWTNRRRRKMHDRWSCLLVVQPVVRRILALHEVALPKRIPLFRLLQALAGRSPSTRSPVSRATW